jgi:hypothetical protein
VKQALPDIMAQTVDHMIFMSGFRRMLRGAGTAPMTGRPVNCPISKKQSARGRGSLLRAGDAWRAQAERGNI